MGALELPTEKNNKKKHNSGAGKLKVSGAPLFYLEVYL